MKVTSKSVGWWNIRGGSEGRESRYPGLRPLKPPTSILPEKIGQAVLRPSSSLASRALSCSIIKLQNEPSFCPFGGRKASSFCEIRPPSVTPTLCPILPPKVTPTLCSLETPTRSSIKAKKVVSTCSPFGSLKKTTSALRPIKAPQVTSSPCPIQPPPKCSSSAKRRGRDKSVITDGPAYSTRSKKREPRELPVCDKQLVISLPRCDDKKMEVVQRKEPDEIPDDFMETTLTIAGNNEPQIMDEIMETTLTIEGNDEPQIHEVMIESTERSEEPENQVEMMDTTTEFEESWTTIHPESVKLSPTASTVVCTAPPREYDDPLVKKFMSVSPDLFVDAPYFNPMGSMRRLQIVIEMFEKYGDHDQREYGFDEMGKGVNFGEIPQKAKDKGVKLAFRRNAEDSFKMDEGVAAVKLQPVKKAKFRNSVL